MAEVKEVKRGDTALFRGTCKDATGTAVSIAGATVCFHLATGRAGSTSILVDEAATNVEDLDAEEVGVAEYEMTPAETAVLGEGHYLAEFEVTWGTGVVKTFPTRPRDLNATVYADLA